MTRFFMKIFNGQIVRDIINNFDPYHINELTRIELIKKEK